MSAASAGPPHQEQGAIEYTTPEVVWTCVPPRTIDPDSNPCTWAHGIRRVRTTVTSR